MGPERWPHWKGLYNPYCTDTCLCSCLRNPVSFPFSSLPWPRHLHRKGVFPRHPLSIYLHAYNTQCSSRRASPLPSHTSPVSVPIILHGFCDTLICHNLFVHRLISSLLNVLSLPSRPSMPGAIEELSRANVRMNPRSYCNVPTECHPGHSEVGNPWFSD